jgi:hypothetical protein
MKSPSILVYLFAVAWCSGIPAHGAVMLSGGGSGAFSQFPSTQDGVVGFDFTVGSQNVLVTGLGVLDLDVFSAGNGLAFSHTVSIWANGGVSLLGSATVPAGVSAPLVNSFRFVDLASPIQLTAGETYTLGAYFPVNSSGTIAPDIFRSNLVPEMQSLISGDFTFERGRIGFGSGFPTITPTGSNNGTPIGPNLQYSISTAPATVPEPSSLLLCAIGLGLAGCIRRRYRLTA